MPRAPRLRAALAALAALALVAGSGCLDEPPPPADTSNLVFDDALVDADFQAFSGSRLDAVTRSTSDPHAGSACLEVTVPSEAEGGYAGGAFVASRPRDLSRFDALTFWARASRDVVIEVVGLGNDNTGTSRYTAEWKRVAVSSTWDRYFIPLPLPARLVAEKGLFFFAAAPVAGQGATLWLDDIGFEALGEGTLGSPRPSWTSTVLTHAVGDTFELPSPSVTWAVNGVDETLEVARATFDYTSSNPAVVRVDDSGRAEALAAGTAVLTASLGPTRVAGQLTVTVAAGLTPGEAAPTPPALAAETVLSLFSGAFSGVPVDSWRADWSVSGPVTDTQAGGDGVKKYTQLQYAGVELLSHPLDATAMSALHLDAWTPDATSLKVKLVDFGADGAYGGGDDRESELTFDASSTPALATKRWVQLELPLGSFTALTSRGHLAQLVLSATSSTVYIDNVYFHR